MNTNSSEHNSIVTKLQTLLQYNSKLLLILFFSVFTILLILCWNSPIIGYEASIYTNTPPLFWILFTINTVIAILLFINTPPDKHYPIRLAYTKMPIFIMGFLLISMYRVRNYGVYDLGQDLGQHIGVTYKLVETGLIDPAFIHYPYLYIQTAFTNLLSSIDLNTLIILHPILKYMLFILGSVLLIREVSISKKFKIITLLLLIFYPIGSSAYIGQTILIYAPYLYSTCLLPLFMYIVIKQIHHPKKVSILFLAQLIIYTIILSHLLSYVWICIILSMSLVYYIIIILKNQSNKNILLLTLKSQISLIIFSSFIWIYLIYITNLLKIPTLTLSKLLFYQEMNSYRIAIAENSISKLMENSAIDILQFIITDYGVLLLLSFIFGIALIHFIRSKEILKNPIIFILSMSAIICLIFAGLPFVLSTLVYDSARFISIYVILVCPISGLYLASIFEHKYNSINLRRAIRLTLTIVITILMVLNVSLIYLSETTYDISAQTTDADVAGISFYFRNADLGYQYLTITIQHFRHGYACGIFHSTYIADNPGSNRLISIDRSSNTAPDYLNYQYNTYFGDSYDDPTYLVYTEGIRQLEEKMSGFMHNISSLPNVRAIDYVHLNNDASSMKIYDNNNLKIIFTP